MWIPEKDPERIQEYAAGGLMFPERFYPDPFDEFDEFDTDFAFIALSSIVGWVAETISGHFLTRNTYDEIKQAVEQIFNERGWEWVQN